MCPGEIELADAARDIEVRDFGRSRGVGGRHDRIRRGGDGIGVVRHGVVGVCPVLVARVVGQAEVVEGLKRTGIDHGRVGSDLLADTVDDAVLRRFDRIAVLRARNEQGGEVGVARVFPVQQHVLTAACGGELGHDRRRDLVLGRGGGSGRVVRIVVSRVACIKIVRVFLPVRDGGIGDARAVRFENDQAVADQIADLVDDTVGGQRQGAATRGAAHDQGRGVVGRRVGPGQGDALVAGRETQAAYRIRGVLVRGRIGTDVNGSGVVRGHVVRVDGVVVLALVSDSAVAGRFRDAGSGGPCHYEVVADLVGQVRGSAAQRRGQLQPVVVAAGRDRLDLVTAGVSAVRDYEEVAGSQCPP